MFIPFRLLATSEASEDPKTTERSLAKVGERLWAPPDSHTNPRMMRRQRALTERRLSEILIVTYHAVAAAKTQAVEVLLGPVFEKLKEKVGSVCLLGWRVALALTDGKNCGRSSQF